MWFSKVIGFLWFSLSFLEYQASMSEVERRALWICRWSDQPAQGNHATVPSRPWMASCCVGITEVSPWIHGLLGRKTEQLAKKKSCPFKFQGVVNWDLPNFNISDLAVLGLQPSARIGWLGSLAWRFAVADLPVQWVREWGWCSWLIGPSRGGWKANLAPASHYSKLGKFYASQISWSYLKIREPAPSKFHMRLTQQRSNGLQPAFCWHSPSSPALCGRSRQPFSSSMALLRLLRHGRPCVWRHNRYAPQCFQGFSKRWFDGMGFFDGFSMVFDLSYWWVCMSSVNGLSLVKKWWELLMLLQSGMGIQIGGCCG